MFGLTRKKELEQLRDATYNLKQEVKEELERILYFVRHENEILRKEIFGVQAAFYDLVDKLNCDLVLNEDGKPKIQVRPSSESENVRSSENDDNR